MVTYPPVLLKVADKMLEIRNPRTRQIALRTFFDRFPNKELHNDLLSHVSLANSSEKVGILGSISVSSYGKKPCEVKIQERNIGDVFHLLQSGRISEAMDMIFSQ